MNRKSLDSGSGCPGVEVPRFKIIKGEEGQQEGSLSLKRDTHLQLRISMDNLRETIY